MNSSNKIKWLIVGLIAAVVLCKAGCFYLDKKYDTWRRPWAYDSSKPLLVGKWQGRCLDPDGVAHQIDLEILLPTTDDERWKRVNRRHAMRNRTDRTFFDGIAILETNGSRDTCELWGGLDKADGHEIHFQFRPINDVHPPGFNLNLLDGNWEGNTIDLAVTFAFFKPDGSSFYSSEDPKHDMKAKLVMSRVSN